jgi:hypothetical protein
MCNVCVLENARNLALAAWALKNSRGSNQESAPRILQITTKIAQLQLSRNGVGELKVSLRGLMHYDRILVALQINSHLKINFNFPYWDVNPSKLSVNASIYGLFFRPYFPSRAERARLRCRDPFILLVQNRGQYFELIGSLQVPLFQRKHLSSNGSISVMLLNEKTGKFSPDYRFNGLEGIDWEDFFEEKAILLG